MMVYAYYVAHLPESIHALDALNKKKAFKELLKHRGDIESALRLPLTNIDTYLLGLTSLRKITPPTDESSASLDLAIHKMVRSFSIPPILSVLTLMLLMSLQKELEALVLFYADHHEAHPEYVHPHSH